MKPVPLSEVSRRTTKAIVNLKTAMVTEKTSELTPMAALRGHLST